MKTVNITFAGLGGQGVLTATDIVASALFHAGFDVKKSEVHGMSQRGGSVSSEVRFGDFVASPMIPEGETDILVVLEASQVENNLPKLKPNGLLITAEMVDASRLANKKAINVALVGLLSTRLEHLAKEDWLAAIKRELPAKIHEANIAAFELGASSLEALQNV